MATIDSISEKRWFMGKGESIRQIRELDSAEIAGVQLQILKVEFENGTRDLYATLNDESKTGALLAEGFGSFAAIQAYKARNGFFKFQRFAELDRASLATATPLGAEQSNSAFFVKGKSFFKMFRRLQPGIHPEQEILSQLNATHFDGVPQLLGFIEYQDNAASYAIGILENHIENAISAWDLFSDAQNTDFDFFAETALELGRTSARMHRALKDLIGTPVQPEEIPYAKLAALLKANGKEDLLSIIEKKQSLFATENRTDTNLLTPQRIHGDYHLGQLLYKDGKFTVLDFEGEPTRTLDYRRRLRSPAADIAGMMRSFAYAAAVRKAGDNFEQVTTEAFLKGYSEESGFSVEFLKKEAQPFIWGKAIYEACYELEYRPDWFWIPEAALKSGL
jgi:predicted trehalose synthase